MLSTAPLHKMEEINNLLTFSVGYNWSFQRWKVKLLEMISINIFSIGSCNFIFQKLSFSIDKGKEAKKENRVS